MGLKAFWRQSWKRFRKWFWGQAERSSRVPVSIPAELCTPREPLGRNGERIARWYLEQIAHQTFLEANAKARLSPKNRKVSGELDLIMEDGSELVFVEVRTRDAFSERFGSPADSVNRRKQIRVCRAAHLWMKQNQIPETRPVRFDIVSILWPTDQPPDIRHLPNAFPWISPDWRKGR